MKICPTKKDGVLLKKYLEPLDPPPPLKIRRKAGSSTTQGKNPGQTLFFAFGRLQSSLLKALESLFDPPSLQTLLKLVTKKPTMTHLMSSDT
jgi:hypothetical protein